MSLEEYLTFDDVALVPQYNNVDSRLEPSLETWLTNKRKMDLPILAANMDTVIGDDLASVLINNGIIPIFHRFQPLSERITQVQKFTDKCFISCGLNDMSETLTLLNEPCLGVCVDIAHGHSESMKNYIEELRRKTDKDIIAGNVCTSMAVHDLVTWGANAVKVGIGPGSCCTTRVTTGLGTPQWTTIKKCAEVANRLRVPIIADGGIRGSRDIALAIGAGASSVMIGGLFSKTFESSAPKKNVIENGVNVIYAGYRGQASKDFQDDFYGGLKKGTVAEGVKFDIKCSGSANELLNELRGGLRSAMTYGGARNIKEFQRKAEFVRVTPSYSNESNPRMNITH